MKFDINFRYMPDFLYIKTAGEASVNSFDELLSSIVHDPKWIKGTDQLIDHRNLILDSVSPDDISNIMDIVSNYIEKIGTGRCAFVVKDPASFGIARMYDLIGGDRLHNSVGVFYSINEARNWLKS